MAIRVFQWMKNHSLKAKLCVLTVLLLGIVMTFVGYVVLEQQRRSLLIQMQETGAFLVKNLAKNVVSALLDGDSLSLNHLITSLQARERVQANPARFTPEEYKNFLSLFFLEDKIQALEPLSRKQGKNVYIDVDNLAPEQLTELAADVFRDVLLLARDLGTPQQYEMFFTQYPWTRSFVEALTTLDDLEVTPQLDEIPEAQRKDFIEKLAERIFAEILSYVKNPFIGYAIVVDKEGIIQAHPEIAQLGEQYHWPEGTLPLDEDDEIKMQPCLFKGEPHFDLASPVIVRDKNIGKAYIGAVHIGLREEYIRKNMREARYKILSLTIVALLLGSMGTYALASLIVKPVKTLVQDAEILGKGELDHQIRVSTLDEVGMLASTLDSTRIKLKKAQEQLVANERLARELEIAREIQMALLPKETPSLDHVELGTLYRAASQVGGDLYDFFWVSEDELGVVVADVSGKGIPGSLVMTMAKAVIRAKAIKSDSPLHKLPAGLGGDPASVFRKTNQMLFQDIRKGMFITANYGILNIKTLRFNFVSAGHNDTLIYNCRTQELRSYNPKGIALGLDKGTLFDMMLQDQEISLSPGDLLLQYTDGITEAMNAHREEFGEERLNKAIQAHAHENVNDFLRSLDQDIREFTEGFPQSDDITAVVIKVK